MIDVLKFNNYQEAAARTDMDTQDNDYYFMQLFIECHELKDALNEYYKGKDNSENVLKEFGDVIWFIFAIKRRYYADNLWTDYKRDFYVQWLLENDDDGPIELLLRTLDLIASLTNLHIKFKFHGHNCDHKAFESLLMTIFANIMLLMFRMGITFEEVADLNIEKLRKRYPDKFSQEASINRVENESPEARRERIFNEAIS